MINVGILVEKCNTIHKKTFCLRVTVVCSCLWDGPLDFNPLRVDPVVVVLDEDLSPESLESYFTKRKPRAVSVSRFLPTTKS